MKHYEMKVLSTKQENAWTSLLEHVKTPDIYYTPEYLKIYENSYSEDINEAFCGESLLFFFGNDQENIIYPFIKRKINTLPFMKKDEEEIFDILSPYGYSGPIVTCSDKDAEKNLIKQYLDAFDNFCKKNNIVTEFIRFHPLLKNHELFKEFIPIDIRNRTAYIDLTKNKETLFKELDKKTRNLVRKAEKNGISIEQTTRRDDLEMFTNLYLNTMEKNLAQKKYMFPFKFFENTMEFLKENITLFIAKYQEKIIAASLFMHKYEFIHYHFSGSDKDYKHLAPNNLLLWEVIQWGKKSNYTKFHLGGGSGKDDTLFRFKAGFSSEQSSFCTANIIHNYKTYKRLCELKDSVRKTNNDERQTAFFPYYRKL